MISYISEGRPSDSPYIEMVWHGQVVHDYSPVCPADVRWNLLFAKRNDQVRVTIEGPTTQHVPKNQPEGSEFLVIKFKLGVFMPNFPINDLRDTDALLPEASSKSFWLQGFAWEMPDYNNVETFVDRLVRTGILMSDPVIPATLEADPPGWSSRTVRRRFLQATGLTHAAINQIERAQQAAAMLEEGLPILDVVYQAGYADQPHLTRALRRFIGTTPAQIARLNQPV